MVTVGSHSPTPANSGGAIASAIASPVQPSSVYTCGVTTPPTCKRVKGKARLYLDRQCFSVPGMTRGLERLAERGGTKVGGGRERHVP
jgi:hypothetical protein